MAQANGNSDMITGPIPQMIRKIAIPASIGFFFNTMYNVVDTYYAGLLSTEALAALSLSFPIFFIIIALGQGISSGATALISNALGKKKRDEAQVYATQAVTFGIIISLFLTVLGLVISPFLFSVLGAEGAYLETAMSYITVIFYGSFFFILINVLNASLIAQGDTKTFRNFLIAGFLLNLVLDPWFMFGGLGMPAMGIAGAAWATVIIQVIGTIYMGWKAWNTDLLKGLKNAVWKPIANRFRDLAAQGFPASLSMMTVALGIFIITYFISWFGKDAVAAYGIATRIEQIALLPTIGINIAALALVGQNNGAGRMDRVKETIKTSIRYGVLIMLPASFLLAVFREVLMGIFTDDAQVISIGTEYLLFAAFLPAAYVILFTVVSSLQGMKKPMFGLWIGLARQIVLPVIVFTFAVKVMGTGILGIWWGIFLIVWASTGVSLLYLWKVLNAAEVDNDGKRD